MLDNMKDKTFLLMCTVRYCLKSQSSIVGWIHDLLIRHWNEIPRNDRKTILEDIKNHRHDKGFYPITFDGSTDFIEIGNAFNKELWDEILELGIKDKLIV